MMNRIYLFSVLLILSSMISFAQVTVDNSGILVGQSGAGINPAYQVNVGNMNQKFSNGLHVYNWPNSQAGSVSMSNAINAMQFISSFDASYYALKAWVAPIFPVEMKKGRAYGLYSTAGYATLGYNYGVFSELAGTSWGTAIYGASTTGTNQFIFGKYAGYFNGCVNISENLGIGVLYPSYPLDVNGIIRCETLTQTSDLRGKTNIADLKSTTGQIGKLRPVTYNLKPKDYAEYYEIFEKSGVKDTGKVVLNTDEDVRRYFALGEKKDDNRKHIGFIAQELKEVFPELVYEDDKGMLSVDYISLIPVLVSAVQEMSGTIQNLRKEIDELKNTISTGTAVKANGADNFSFTVFPNPTSGFVTIDYTLYIGAPLSIELFNVYGHKVKLILPQQNQKEGTYSVQASVGDLIAGAYLVKVTCGNQTESKQLMVN